MYMKSLGKNRKARKASNIPTSITISACVSSVIGDIWRDIFYARRPVAVIMHTYGAFCPSRRVTAIRFDSLRATLIFLHICKLDCGISTSIWIDHIDNSIELRV